MYFLIFITEVLDLLKQKSSGRSFIAEMERVSYFIYLALDAMISRCYCREIFT